MHVNGMFIVTSSLLR